jgi:hypothetical protein
MKSWRRWLVGFQAGWAGLSDALGLSDEELEKVAGGLVIRFSD